MHILSGYSLMARMRVGHGASLTTVGHRPGQQAPAHRSRCSSGVGFTRGIGRLPLRALRPLVEVVGGAAQQSGLVVDEADGLVPPPAQEGADTEPARDLSGTAGVVMVDVEALAEVGVADRAAWFWRPRMVSIA
jgi:hypothetical protein